MLREECGVLTGKWLPYGYLLVPMAATWRDAIGVAGPASGANRERFKRWFWCSGFSQTYDRAANTQAAKDYNELRKWFDGGDPPEVVAQFDFESTRLREITPRQQSVYKALVALVLRNGALDFHHASLLTAASIAVQGVDDHHVFPQAYLNPPGAELVHPTELVDCVLNRTLIDRDTNQRIGKRAPSDYLDEIGTELASVGDDALDRLLRSHLLPCDQHSPLLADDFERFLSWRQQRMLDEMGQVTGKALVGPAAAPPVGSE